MELTPEQKAAILAMPRPVAEKILAQMEGFGVDPYGAAPNAVGARNYTPTGGGGATPNPPPQMPPSPGLMQKGAPQGGFGQMPPMGIPQPDFTPQGFEPNLIEGIGIPPQGYREGNNSFIPGAEYQTAQMGGIDLTGGGNGPGTTAGPANKAAEIAIAYGAMMRNLDEYERLVNEQGGRLRPGPEKERLENMHAGLMMQLKDVYQMGAPQAGDLAMLERLLPNPNNFGMRALETLGIADAEDRTTAGLSSLRTTLRNMVEPWAQAGNINLDEVYKPQMSDDALLEKYGLK